MTTSLLSEVGQYRPLLSIPTPFGNGRLDRLDRRILEAICEHGREGQSFNKLVSEVRPFVSRSTFALRTKRLEKLGFVETFPDAKERQVRRTRGKPSSLMLMRIVARMKQQCAEVELSLVELSELKANAEFGVDELTRRIEPINDRIRGIFALVGSYAVLFGEGVAGDLLLPMVVGDFRKVNSALLSLLRSHPELAHAIERERLTSLPTDTLRDDFRYAFGKDLRDALPKFTKHLNDLKK
jgi:hypothetical protein